MNNQKRNAKTEKLLISLTVEEKKYLEAKAEAQDVSMAKYLRVLLGKDQQETENVRYNEHLRGESTNV